MGAQVADVLAHLGGASGAVEADDVRPHGVQGGKGGADLATHQHAPGGLDGDLYLYWKFPARFGHGPPAGDDGRFGLEQVLDRLDNEEVHAAGYQPRCRFLVAVAHFSERDLSERGDLGARAEGAGHPAVPAIAVGHVSGDGGGRLGQFPRPFADAVLGQHPGDRPEAVGLDHMATDIEK